MRAMRTLYRDFPLMAERHDCEHFNAFKAQGGMC